MQANGWSKQYLIAACYRVACAVRPKESGTIDTFYADLGEFIEFDERLAALSGLLLGDVD